MLSRPDASDSRQRGRSVKPLGHCVALKSCCADGMDNIQTSSARLRVSGAITLLPPYAFMA
jgi:hypothetical protein